MDDLSITTKQVPKYCTDTKPMQHQLVLNAVGTRDEIESLQKKVIKIFNK